MANRQDRFKDRQDNWRDWHDRHYNYHDNWYHGYWHSGWQPGSYWNYWWDNYPVMTAFGVTTWAINRVGWAFGYNRYYNPYYSSNTSVVYNYSQPIVMTPTETTLAGDPTQTSVPSAVTPESLSAFDQARQEFFAGDYEAALKSTDAALKKLPNDAVIHEFRALTLFALGNYKDAAATLYAVLSVGPGWDWTTMTGLYPNVDTYTKQLRALEDYRDKNPQDPAARFVLAYHYTTAGNADEAAAELKKLVELAPEDQLAQQLLLQADPDAKIANLPKQVQPPKPDQAVSEGDLKGQWTAKRDGGTFEMDLNEDGTFSWKFSDGSTSQEVTGVWGIDEDGILALEMNDEGVMLAQLILNGNQLDFYMLGDTQGSEPLKFNKS